MTISFGYTAVMPVAVPKKKRTLLPLLTVLFVFSYGLMTLLIVEQGSAIQSQRNLIKVLMTDSTELWTARGKAIGEKEMARTQAQTHAQAPPTQAPLTQTPSTQAAPQHHSRSQAGRVAKPYAQAPPVPASDLVDRRRALTTI